MLDFVFLFFFGFMAFKIYRQLRREKFILSEFKQSGTLALLVLLFPVGSLVMLLGSYAIPFPFAFILATGCYIPTLLIARRQLRSLETAGTDRVQTAQSAISSAFGTALVGMVYVAIVFAISFAAKNIN